MFTVYVLQNSQNNRIYIGYTSNLEHRLAYHNNIRQSKKSSYTTKMRQAGLWNVVYKEEYETRAGAIQREKELKTSRGRNFIKRLNYRP